jgi:hypothetical protein
LKPENVTYQLRIGASVNETNPHALLAICPIDGNLLQYDGTVIGPKAAPPPVWKPYLDLIRFDTRTRFNAITLAAAALLGLALLWFGIRLKPHDEHAH